MSGTARILSLALILGLVFVTAAGCSRRKSSLLLERQSRGSMEEEGGVATAAAWALEPTTHTKTLNGMTVTVEYAPPAYLDHFFRNRHVFQEFAGLNPFFSEQMVFYVKLANAGPKKIRLNPEAFVLLDDKGNQYNWLHPDYILAMAESRAPVSAVTRGMLEDARPGYFGIGLPVGRILPKSQQRYALMQLSQLKEGYLHPGVVYDGLISFWNPHHGATKLTLLLSNIKTDFDANDWPKTAWDFAFEMNASHQSVNPK